MKNYTVIIRLLISLGCIVFLLNGCDDSAGGPSQPSVVRKKIADADSSSAAVSNKTVAAEPGPAQPIHAKAEPQKPADTAVNTAAAQPAAAPADAVAPAQPVSAQPVGPGQNNQEAQLRAQAAPQPAQGLPSMPEPKSDISPLAPQTAADTQPTPATAAATAEDTLVASSDLDAVPLYDPAGKIDPFEPLFKDKPDELAVKKSPRKRRPPQTPLEKIDLSQLKLVAIVTASTGNRALVEESSGKGYVIKKGTYIGMNAGKVADIQKDKVVVEEEYEDVFGKLKVQTKELTLPKPPGEL